MFAEYTTHSPEETIQLAERLALRLIPGDAVLLFGDLGTGKTHFSKGLAKGLGVAMTIKSPTYTYVNRYPIFDRGANGGADGQKQFAPQFAHREAAPQFGKRFFYHYDLYRMEEGAEMASIGLEESLADSTAIHSIEWADRLAGQIPPQCVLVNLSGSGKERKIQIEFIRPTILPESAVEAYYEEWSTPQNVRRHCRMVTHVAMTVADSLIRKGEIVNANLIYTAGMLHDMARVCDFLHFDRSKFTESVSDTLWAKWSRLREAHAGKRHAAIAFEQLMGRGYSETAEVIRLHEADLLGLEPGSYLSVESKLLYYSDKRVKHDTIVDLAERFRDGRERYGAHNDEKTRNLFDGIEQVATEMERDLFSGLDIKPEDIQPIKI